MENLKLLLAIREQQIKQKELADQAGICASTLSEIIRGRRNATDEQKKLIAEHLKVSVKSIFPSSIE